MPAEIVTRTEAIEYAVRAGISGTLSNAQWDEFISRAVDAIRQAALNSYTAASFELLTAANAPDEMREHCLAMVLAAATKGDAGRSETIGIAATEAAKWRGYLAGGSTHYDESPDAILVKRSTGSGSVTHYRRASEDVFDRCNDSQNFNARDPEI